MSDSIPGFTYAWMIPFITRIARPYGYAIGVHGSMSRDLDLIAVPWVENASEPKTLLEAICGATDGILQLGEEVKPNGRTSYNITFKNGWHFIDISIMEKKQSPKVFEQEEKNG